MRSLEQGLGATPAMLLSGSGKVGDAFTAGPVEQRQDSDLVPAAAEAARLGFRDA